MTNSKKKDDFSIHVYGNDDVKRSITHLGEKMTENLNSLPDEKSKQLGGIFSHIEKAFKDGAMWLGAGSVLAGRAGGPVVGLGAMGGVFTGLGLGAHALYATAMASDIAEPTLAEIGSMVAVTGGVVAAPYTLAIAGVAGVIACVAAYHGEEKLMDGLLREVGKLDPDLIQGIREKLETIHISPDDARNLAPINAKEGVDVQSFNESIQHAFDELGGKYDNMSSPNHPK